jgi:hypothetical protein
MSKRPVFVPAATGCASRLDLSFEWHAGLSLAQKRKSIGALHGAAASAGLRPVLEVSTKSPEPVGQALSALYLGVTLPGASGMPVECAFQGSKVFARGGPYRDLYTAPARAAKQDLRLRESGALTAFDLMGEKWPLVPPTAFYDWLYLLALTQNQVLSGQLLHYAGFTDIEFNPKRSINTQAEACALYVALTRSGVDIPGLLEDRTRFLQTLAAATGHRQAQADLGLFL